MDTPSRYPRRCFFINVRIMIIRTILTTLLFCAAALPVLAVCVIEEVTIDTGNIQLSELYPAPASGEEEFIELYNAGRRAVDLSGWVLEDDSGKQYVISAEDFPSTTVEPGDWFVVERSVSRIALNNTNDGVYLYAGEELYDQTQYEGASSGASWSLVAGDWQWTSETAGARNVASEEELESNDTQDQPVETSANIRLNEIMSNPVGSDTEGEWIEIVNEGSEAVSLHQWSLSDGTKSFELEGLSIAAGEYLVFERPETGITLNNSSENVYLIDPFDAIIHGVELAGGEEGQSFARNGDAWSWTDEPTPGEENVFELDETEEGENEEERAEEEEESEEAEDVPASGVMSISDFRLLEDDEDGVVEGVVTVVPDVLAGQYFYVQDSGAGIQVYSYRKAFPQLTVGDVIRITGTKSTTRNESRIKTTAIEDIEILETGKQVEAMAAVELDEALEGMFVHVEGEVLDSSSTSALISENVNVLIKAGTGVNREQFEESTQVRVQGIVSQSGDEYRLIPRQPEDVETVAVEAEGLGIVEPVNAATSGASAPEEESAWKNEYLLLLLLLAGAGLYAWQKQRSKQLSEVTAGVEPLGIFSKTSREPELQQTGDTTAQVSGSSVQPQQETTRARQEEHRQPVL